MRRLFGRAHAGSIISALVILAFVLAYITIGYITLDEASRHVPILAGLVTVFLLAVELARQGLSSSESPAPETMTNHGHTESPDLPGKEWRVLLSVAAAVTAIFLVGFLIAIPVYLVGAITLVGRRPLRVAVLTALVTTATIYGAFELLLSYELFPGILFS